MTIDTLIIQCPQCGTKNRVPAAKISDRPICGKCKTPLPPQPVYTRPVDISDHSFQKEVLNTPGVVLMDCWAPWCGPCKMISPILDQLALAYKGRVKITKLNVDENPGTSSQYNIQSIPTMLFFKNGKRVMGAHPKNEIERIILGMI